MALLSSDQDTKIVPLIPRTSSSILQRSLSKVAKDLPSLQSLFCSSTRTGSWDADAPLDNLDALVRARWWKLLPLEMLKMGGLILVIPTLTNVKTQFFNGDTAKAARVQSVMESSRAVCSALVVAQLGRLSDSVGRRPLIILSVLCTTVPLLCLTFSSNLYYYLVTFTLAGALGGQESPASPAYVADCCPQEKRTRIFGLQSAIMSAMFMLLPASGALFEKHVGQHSLYLIVVCIELVALTCSCCLPESLPAEKRQPYAIKPGLRMVLEPYKKLIQLLAQSKSAKRDLAVLRFLKSMTLGIPTTFALRSLLSFTDEDFAVLMAIAGFSGMIVQLVILRYMVRFGWSELTIILFSLIVDVCYYVGLSLLCVFPSKLFAFALASFDSLSAVFLPAMTSLITKGVDDGKGFMLGTFTTIASVTSFFSPLLMATVYQLSPVAPFMLTVVMNLLCILMAMKMRLQVTENRCVFALVEEATPDQAVGA